MAACGDDDTVNNPMCPDPVDAAACPLPPDAPIPPMFKEFDADEGGELRAEYINTPPGGTTMRITAFAYKNPGSVKFTQFLNLAGCTDVSTSDLAKMYWPTTSNPVDEREYYDLSSVVVHNETTAINVPRRNMPTGDPFGRPHVADEWFFQPTGVPAALAEKTKYSVTLGGSDTFPGQTFPNALYMPAAFDLAGTPGSALETTAGIGRNTGADAMTDPDMGGPQTNGVLAAGTDLSVSWTTPTDTPPEVENFGLVGFLAPTPKVVCIEPNMGATGGTIVVPANFVDIAKAAAAANTNGVGQMARQTFHHVVRELKDSTGATGKRFDIVGVWCFAGTNYR
jgi:hypothetical protein